MSQGELFPVSTGPVSLDRVNPILEERHYLGPVRRGMAWEDEYGVAVLQTPPTSRRLPADWIELTRWCLNGIPNGGSRQWKAIRRWLAQRLPEATTVVSYSDPSVGHTGAIYKACGWWWAPTWHRIQPPPSGNGSWTDLKQESVKDRWLYPLHREDPRRADLMLELHGDSYRDKLRGDRWKSLRMQVRKRDDHRCRKCGTAEALTTHHIHYKTVGREDGSELVTLCWACHRQEHEEPLRRSRRRWEPLLKSVETRAPEQP